MPPPTGCPVNGPPYPEVTGVICRVPSTSFSQAPWYALPVHLCRFRVRSISLGLFPGRLKPPAQSDKHGRHSVFVTTSRPGNINPVPIDYGFRPRLRGRLTLRGLALRRNPWTFGDRVSHPVCRYSCQHSHFRYLQRPSRDAFIGLRNAPLPQERADDKARQPLPPPEEEGFGLVGEPKARAARLASPPSHPFPRPGEGFLNFDNCSLLPAASVHGLSPVTSSAQAGLTRPVSCYAFFKGWLLLSQPPGCFGLPTSFTT